ncbi:Poly(A) RNA polymerase cid13 [Fusarium oxysporum f. sp. albedinis]|nr:Poly(A) RNA polymerase cid13 [Fusarium oxysporum f. sp. albedinis]
MNSVLVPYTRYHDFVERSRSRILKDLKPQFGFGHKSTTKRRLRVSLYGLRGIRYRSLWARQQWTHRSGFRSRDRALVATTDVLRSGVS